MKLRYRALAGALLLAIGAAHADEPKQLNLYIWNDYLGKNTIAKFEKETGIKVKVDLYDSNETLQAKLLTGRSGYDLVVPSTQFSGKQIQAGIYRPLEKSKLKNWANLDPTMLQKGAVADPGNQFTMPYMWGTTSVAINVDRVKKALGGQPLPTDAYKLLFDPQYAGKLKQCGVAYMESSSEVLAMAMIYLGRDPGKFVKQDIQDAEGFLKPLRGNVRMLNSSPIDAMANGDVCAAMMFSGDAYTAKRRAEEAKNGVKVQYLISDRGAEMWMDVMAIPKDAPHPDNAHKFLDYIMRPDVVADISNTVYYANPNKAATPLVDKAISGDARIYPDEALKKKLILQPPIPPEIQRLKTIAFNRFRTAAK